MPTSLDLNDRDLLDFISENEINTILDVGPGDGRIADNILQGYPHCSIDAVEIETDYVIKYKLEQKYKKVYNQNIKDFCLNNSQLRYDLVVFFDILEHLFRSEAFDVLDCMLYRSKFIIVQWPNDYLQDDYQGVKSEIHKSNFTIRELINQGFDVVFFKKKNYKEYNFSMNFCIMQGYKNN